MMRAQSDPFAYDPGGRVNQQLADVNKRAGADEFD